MSPLSARSRAWRAVLSAVAGGGLTAAGLGGPLGGPALGAAPPASAAAASPPPAAPRPAPGAPNACPAQPASTTSTATPVTSAPASTTPVGPPGSPAGTTGTAPATTSAPQASTPPPPEAPTVVLQRKQKATPSVQANESLTSAHAQAGKAGDAGKKASSANNVASSPESVAEAGALAAVLASSEASAQALAFYRIPLFLLPIYKAAAVQYGVPWQVLAAINEIETDYGSDLSVSTAGAVGWMQFMPSTWLQYGVDALNAGYADPYNPVDAIFAAARYLRAAGAATELRAAILAYNHSEEYADSVLLRAKLISTYPKNVIAALTGLIDGRLPVTGKRVSWGPLPVALLSASNATANATAVPGQAAGASAGASSSGSEAAKPATAPPPPEAGAAGSLPPSPTAAAASATSSAGAPKVPALQLVNLTSAPNASVVAVQDGRVVKIGKSARLGRYLVLRDVYGDLFTYAGLGSIAPSYVLANPTASPRKSRGVEAASTRDPAPTLPASAGIQSPLTLRVKAPPPAAMRAAASGHASAPPGSEEGGADGTSKVRLFAHPGNPDARAAAASAASRARRNSSTRRIPLRSGSVVASGTVLGHVSVPRGDRDGHLRFAIRPAGDSSTIDPGPVLANWAQLQAALHPQGATAANALLGATASDVFLLSKAQLQRSVLSDPDITIYECGRQDIAAGDVDKRILAVLAFLSRSGLEPTVSALRCGEGQFAASGALSAAYRGDAVDISAINGTPVAAHQGPGTITDLAIRTLLTLPSKFVPYEIVSLMRYPGAPNTHSESAFWNRIHLDFRPAPAAKPAVVATVAHSAHGGRTAPSPLVTTSALSAVQWNQLMQRGAGLPMPAIAAKPTSSAIPDRPKRR